ncbi:hypothetical protein ABZ558_33885 [Streptomyces coeruleorubidus]
MPAPSSHHDAKFGIPLLQLALDLPVGYVGAMGSTRTHDERLRLLINPVTGHRTDPPAASPVKSDHGRLREETADPGRRPTGRYGNVRPVEAAIS